MTACTERRFTNHAVVLDHVPVKLFFPKHATNHPYPAGAQADTPNWFYYWGQDVQTPLTAIRKHVNQWDDGINGFEMKWFVIMTGVTEIDVYESAGVSNLSDITSYQWCTSKLAHENQHEFDFRNNVWASTGGAYIRDLDQDGDFLEDWWETSHNEITGHNNEPDPANHFQKWGKWSDNNAYDVQNNYPDKSTTNDWAFPGSNWK